MKYREIYAVLNQRKLVVPGFRYSDFSGWRAANQSYMTRQRPLWIIAEDPAVGKRLWITHEYSSLSVTICKMDERGSNLGASRHIACENRTKMAAVLQSLFTSPNESALVQNPK